VADVNVLFSGFVSKAGSPPQQIIEMWMGGIIDLVVSPKLLEEAGEVFERPSLQRWVQARGAAWIALLTQLGRHHEDPVDDRWTIRLDPDDEYLVALAVAANAVLVTGDKDLPMVEPTPPIRIVNARTFVSMVDAWLRDVDADRR
jgi:uncharacterized protein